MIFETVVLACMHMVKHNLENSHVKVEKIN